MMGDCVSTREMGGVPCKGGLSMFPVACTDVT